MKNTSELVNEEIRFKEVLVIDHNGEQLGIKSRREALQIAADVELDLVCVAATGNPPVCKIMDYGKYRFELQKKQKDMRKNQKTISIKEVRFSPKIDQHDLDTRAKKIFKWIEKGDKVKISVEFRGRQITHANLGEILLNNFLKQFEEVAVIEKKPKLEGRSLGTIIAPKKK